MHLRHLRPQAPWHVGVVRVTASVVFQSMLMIAIADIIVRVTY